MQHTCACESMCAWVCAEERWWQGKVIDGCAWRRCHTPSAGGSVAGLVRSQAASPPPPPRCPGRYVADKAVAFPDFLHLPHSDCHHYWRKLRPRPVADGAAASQMEALRLVSGLCGVGRQGWADCRSWEGGGTLRCTRLHTYTCLCRRGILRSFQRIGCTATCARHRPRRTQQGHGTQRACFALPSALPTGVTCADRRRSVSAICCHACLLVLVLLGTDTHPRRYEDLLEGEGEDDDDADWKPDAVRPGSFPKPSTTLAMAAAAAAAPPAGAPAVGLRRQQQWQATGGGIQTIVSLPKAWHDRPGSPAASTAAAPQGRDAFACAPAPEMQPSTQARLVWYLGASSMLHVLRGVFQGAHGRTCPTAVPTVCMAARRAHCIASACCPCIAQQGLLVERRRLRRTVVAGHG